MGLYSNLHFNLSYWWGMGYDLNPHFNLYYWWGMGLDLNLHFNLYYWWGMGLDSNLHFNLYYWWGMGLDSNPLFNLYYWCAMGLDSLISNSANLVRGLSIGWSGTEIKITDNLKRAVTLHNISKGRLDHAITDKLTTWQSKSPQNQILGILNEQILKQT